MAKIGLDNFLYGILTENAAGVATYGSPRKPGKAINASVSISSNSAALYADNALAESDTSFQSGTVTLGIDDDDLATQATLLGHELVGNTIIRNANDTAPYVGFGRIITKVVNGVKKYKVEFLSKVKFSEPSQEDNTKGESVEFGTVTIEGQISTLAGGTWSKAQTFDTYAEAKEYLEGLFVVPTTVSISFNANGGTGTVNPIEVEPGATFTFPSGSGLTPPGAAAFTGWSSDSAGETAIYRPGATSTARYNQTYYAQYIN